MNLALLRNVWMFAGMMFLPGCAGIADVSWKSGQIPDFTPAHFTVCFNHGCKSLADVELTPEQWQETRELFRRKPVTASQERERIAQAVGKLETLTGRLTGIDKDRGGSLSGLWILNQMDCIDETNNTNTYLVMLHNDGLLKFHVPAGEARRILPYLFLHATAVIQEVATGKKYAVDSWFLDNGHPPFIVPLSAWRWGWSPGDEIPGDEQDSAAKTGESR